MTIIKTNIIITNNNSNNNNTKTTKMGLQIYAHENIDGQNNKVTKELMDRKLILESILDPV